MAEVKFTIAKLEWMAFSVRVAVPVSVMRSWMVNRTQRPEQYQRNILDVHKKAFRETAKLFKGDWCIVEQTEILKVFIQDRNDAMLFKLSHADILTKEKF